MDYEGLRFRLHIKIFQKILRKLMFAVNSQSVISCSPLWEMVQEGIDLKNIKWSQH